MNDGLLAALLAPLVAAATGAIGVWVKDRRATSAHRRAQGKQLGSIEALLRGQQARVEAVEQGLSEHLREHAERDHRRVLAVPPPRLRTQSQGGE